MSTDVEIAAAHKGTPTGPLVSPDDAEKGTHRNPISYFCPRCKCELILRQGEVRVWHFAHKGDRPVGCNGYTKETWQHTKGKRLVRENIHKTTFLLHYVAACNHPIRTESCHGSSAVRAEEEGRIITEFGSRYADVLVTFPDRQIAVEVHQTHAVTEEKFRAVEGCGIAIVEIEAALIIQKYDIEESAEVIWERKYKNAFNCDNCEREARERMSLNKEEILARAILTAEIYARRMEEERRQREAKVVRIRIYEENKKRLAEEREQLRYDEENKKRLAEESEWSRRIEELERVIKSTNAKEAICKRRMTSDEYISRKRARDAVYRLCKCGTSIMTPSVMCKSCAQRRNLVIAEIVETGSYFFGTYTPRR